MTQTLESQDCDRNICTLWVHIVPVTQLRLQGARKIAQIQRQREELTKKAHECATSQLSGNELLEYDKHSALSRAESIGYWIGNTFCFSLLTQGPFCAGILLQVRPLTLLISSRVECSFFIFAHRRTALCSTQSLSCLPAASASVQKPCNSFPLHEAESSMCCRLASLNQHFCSSCVPS
jgi:hypothetical protein